MCGRFTLIEPIPWLAEIMGMGNPESAGEVPPRYNVSPGTEVFNTLKSSAKSIGKIQF